MSYRYDTAENNAMDRGQRIAYLDYARVIVALLVILGHLLTDGSNGRLYIYAFHMPFFFLVSGMLHKYKGAVEWKKYVRTLLLPAAVFIGAYIIISSFLFYFDVWDYSDVYKRSMPSGIIGIGLDQAYVTVRGALRGSQMANGPCWFLLALFWCKIMTDVLEKDKRFRYFLMGGGIVLFALVYKYNVLYLKQAIMALPLYWFGYKAKSSIDRCLKMKYQLLMIVILCGMSFLLTKINGRVSMYAGWFGARGLYSIPLFYLNAIVGSMAVLYFSSLFKERSLVTKAANSLITILGMQLYFCYTVKFTIGWAEELTMLSFLEYMGIAAVILVLCYWIHQILYKRLPWIYGRR